MAWFKQKPQDTPEKRAVAAMTEFVDCLLRSDEDAINASEDARLVFFAFVFGGITAYAMRHNLSPPQAHAVAIALYMRALEMDAQQSAELAQFGIDATSKHSPWNYAAHAGMDEFFAWEQRPNGYLPAYLLPALAKAPPTGRGS